MNGNVKRFLYLDYDSTFSCYSQIMEGLPTKITETTDNKNEDTNDIEASVEAGVNSKLKLFGSGVDADLSARLAGSGSSLRMDSYEKSVEKLLHDDLFNDLEVKLKEANGDPVDARIGEFVKFSGKVSIVDAEYIKALFTNSEFIKYVEREEISKKIIDVIDKTAQKRVEKQVRGKYDDAKKMIKMLSEVIPYRKFMLIGENVVVLEEKYLRDDPECIPYKYGGNMTVFGYVTNKIELQDDLDKMEHLLDIVPVMNGLLLTLLGKKKLVVVHAIGVYY